MRTRDAPVATILLVVATVAVLLVTADRPATSPAPGATRGAGTAWCAPQRANLEDATLVLAADPTASGELALEVSGLRDPDTTIDLAVPAGAATDHPVEPAATTVRVAWSGGPHATSQVATFPRGPAGTIAGPCPTMLHDDVVVPALTTADGASGTVAMINPTDEEALVDMEVLTADGTEVPPYGQDIPVAPGATSVVFADDVAPNRDALAVRIRRVRGRVAVTGMQRVPATSGVQGRSWVVAPARPATTWHLPWVATGGDPSAGLAPGSTGSGSPLGPTDSARGWLAVTNPGGAPIDVTVELLTETGPVPLDAVPSPVPAGSTVRVELDEVLAEVAGPVGATVRGDLPLVVGAGATIVAGDDLSQTGIATLTGHAEPATRWIVSGPAGSGRHHLLAVANPTTRPAVVTVTRATGDGAGPGPDPVTVPPGSTRTVPIDDPDAGDTITLFVEASGGQVVADLRSGVSGTGPLDLVAVHGTPTG